MHNLNIWNKWDPLKSIMLGDIWNPEFFDYIKEDKIRTPLKRICEETKQDLENFENILRQFDCTVLRPEIDPQDSIENYYNENGELGFLPRPPLQPRDNQIVIGNKLYANKLQYDYLLENKYILNTLEKNFDVTYFPMQDANLTILPEDRYMALAGHDWPSYDYFFRNINNPTAFQKHVYKELLDLSMMLFAPSSANCFLLGKDVYVDYASPTTQKYLENLFPETRINIIGYGETHSDGCFHPVKPGVILSLYDFQNYAKTFPNWDICYLENEAWEKVGSWTDLKYQNRGKWWVPGEEHNVQLINYIETWLQNWVGYVEESVFDLNVVMLDEHHICVNNVKNKKLMDFLKKHKIEPVHVPFRHRYFWDGGLHCITLDLYREGTQKDYFPDRQMPVIERKLVAESESNEFI